LLESKQADSRYVGISEPSLENLLNLYDIVYPYYKNVRIVPQLQKLMGAR